MTKSNTTAAKAKAAKAKANAVSNKLKIKGDKPDPLSKKKVNLEENNHDSNKPPNKTSNSTSQERDSELDNVRYNDTFITLKVDFTTADAFVTTLPDKYKSFLSPVQIIDDSLIVLTANLYIRRTPSFFPWTYPLPSRARSPISTLLAALRKTKRSPSGPLLVYHTMPTGKILSRPRDTD